MPKKAQKEKLEKDLDFNAGFDHGFGKVAEYKSSGSDESPKPKKTNEQQKPAPSKTEDKQSTDYFQFDSFKEEPKPV